MPAALENTQIPTSSFDVEPVKMAQLDELDEILSHCFTVHVGGGVGLGPDIRVIMLVLVVVTAHHLN